MLGAAAVLLPPLSSLLMKLFSQCQDAPVLLLSLPDQLGSLAGIFSNPGVTNECAPNLTAFKMSHIPLEYRNREALSGVFAKWKPNIVLCNGTAVITIADPSAGERVAW